MSGGLEFDSGHLFAPRRVTLTDQSNQNPGSVSGPTSSGSFVLTLIRGPPQWAIHGPVRLVRRPASHPPDQRHDSAVTYVAIGVVSAIVVKKRFRLCAVTACKARLCGAFETFDAKRRETRANSHCNQYPDPEPGIHDVPANGTRAMAADSTVSATRSSGSRLCRCDLPHARAMVWASRTRTRR